MTVSPAITSLAPASLPEYELELFVAGDSPKSARAFANIQRICEQFLVGRHTLAVVDVSLHPERASQEGLIGLPSLIKRRPGLVRQLVGDLSDQVRVLRVLGLN